MNCKIFLKYFSLMADMGKVSVCIFVTIVPGVVIISNTSCYLFKVRSVAGVLSLVMGQTNSFNDNVLLHHPSKV